MKSTKTTMNMKEWGVPEDGKTETGYDDAAAADKYFGAELVNLPASERLNKIDTTERFQAGLKAMKSPFNVVNPEFIERLKQLSVKGTEHETNV